MLSYFDPQLKGEGDSGCKSGSGAEDKRQVSVLLVSSQEKRGPGTSSPLKSTSNDRPKPSVLVDLHPYPSYSHKAFMVALDKGNRGLDFGCSV